MSRLKLLIVGHARHGKDTVAEIIKRKTGLTFSSSSQAAADIFIYDYLKDKYGYNSPEECFEDRINHRVEWYDLICDYNKDDKSALAKEILKKVDIYVGMRSENEINKCLEENLFDFVIGVYDYRKPWEDKESFDINPFYICDFIIPNGGTLLELDNKVTKILNQITK